jgi:ribosomal protein S18 acetylase RimI-like enzyme
VRCAYCGNDAVYGCGVCGKLLCAEHVKLRTVCALHLKKDSLAYAVRKVGSGEERTAIRKLVKRFWGEEEQLTFDKKFVVAELQAYVAKVRGSVIGFVSFTETKEAVVIVALGVSPRYQGFGIGRQLIEKVETEANRLRKRRVFVSTSNDDLPALAFYQSLGFQVYEVKPDVVAQKHGGVVRGIGGLPVRDELRLRKILN